MNLKNVSQAKSSRAAIHSLKDLLVFFPLILLIILTGCGSNSIPLVQSSDPVEQSTVLTQEAPDQIILSEPTLIASQTNSLNSENYWIAWKDPNLGYIAASRSGVPVTVPNYPPDSGSSLVSSPQGISLAASTGASAEAFDPIGGPVNDPDSCEVAPNPTPSPDLDPEPAPDPGPIPDPDPSPSPTPATSNPCRGPESAEYIRENADQTGSDSNDWVKTTVPLS